MASCKIFTIAANIPYGISEAWLGRLLDIEDKRGICMIKGQQSIQFENLHFDQQSFRRKRGTTSGQDVRYGRERRSLGEDTWEAASTMQKEACLLAMKRASGACGHQISLWRRRCAKELPRQSSRGAGNPMFGLFGACSTAGSSALASMSVAENMGIIYWQLLPAILEARRRIPFSAWIREPEASVHSDRDRSGPLYYKSEATRITGVTIGKIVNYGLGDSQNMKFVWRQQPATPSSRTWKTLTRRKITAGLLPGIWDM